MKSINFSLQSSIDNADFDTLLLPVFDDGTFPEAAEKWEISGLVKKLIEQKDFAGKAGETLMLFEQKDFARVCLIGFGVKSDLTDKALTETADAIAKAITKSSAANVLSLAGSISNDQISQARVIYQLTLAVQKSLYEYTHISRSGDLKPKEIHLESVTYLLNDREEWQAKIDQAQATALGMALTQELADMPSNFCTPTHLAETAKQLAKDYDFDCDILEREKMLNMGMGSFMAVAQGSITPPKMICLSYNGADKSKAPIALVGKGVTFDTGGISLKPGAAMDEMKYDMGGAATVLGVFEALGRLKPEINVVGVIPATENMPSGNAIKPGDVVTSLSGQTIEILNTDAEGRLILCDALTYAQQTYKPSKIIDMATLTGACIIALGHHISAVLGNNQDLVNDLLKASQMTYDRFWQLPLSEEYDEQLKSNFADMANIGGRAAGTITAAQFLARFTKDIDWAHLDIAGTAWTSGANKGATGRPVPALVEYLVSQA
ncbi:leucyl aminopeptidase [Hydrogenovibrio kuenenii]|uniref:leucyl aminopeptidase n=1 Tax=Hydrogenovibrio kuenenii TaxID=63658 RepID=UPI000467D8B7|nr:leucyl aminopeptidase [Hydrogenovibrio kuenenii]